MIFLELVLQNFGPYCGRQVLNLRPLRLLSGDTDDRDAPPIILLGGMNGGGKTTLMDAIRLALYGHRAQCSSRNNLGYSEFLNQSVNRHTPPGEQTRIELTFEHILNNIQVEFKIERVWTQNSKTGKDTLGVSVDNYPDSALTQIWDERIEDLLPLGISNLFLFDGEQVKELAEQEIPTIDVTNAIKTLLGLELAERLTSDIDILVNRKRKALADTKDLASLEKIEQKLTLQQEKYQGAKQQLKIDQKGIEEAQKHHDETSAKFLSEGGKIAKNRSQLETQLSYGNDAIAHLRQSLVEIAADVLPLALISPLLSQAQTQAQKESKHFSAKIAQDVLKARDERFLGYIKNLALLPEQFEQIKLFIEEENNVLEQDINLIEETYLAVDPETNNQLNNA